MITSGLLVQNRGYGTYPSTRTRDRTVAHPYVYGFDSVPVKITEFHNTGLKNPTSVNYNKIFGRGLTPSEKDHFLTHGKTMIQKAAEGVVAGRARRGILKRKNTREMNDSFKNMETFSEWKDFHERDRTNAMSDVDQHGERERYLEEMARRARIGDYKKFPQRVLPPTAESVVISKASSPTGTVLGSVASPTDAERMRVDFDQRPDDAMDQGTVDDEIVNLSTLFRDRLNVANGGPPATPPPPVPMMVDSPENPLLSTIKKGVDLKSVTPIEKAPTYQNELMSAIRSNKKKLKPVTQKDKPPLKKTNSLLDDLTAKLATRRKTLAEDLEDDGKDWN